MRVHVWGHERYCHLSQDVGILLRESFFCGMGASGVMTCCPRCIYTTNRKQRNKLLGPAFCQNHKCGRVFRRTRAGVSSRWGSSPNSTIIHNPTSTGARPPVCPMRRADPSTSCWATSAGPCQRWPSSPRWSPSWQWNQYPNISLPQLTNLHPLHS